MSDEVRLRNGAASWAAVDGETVVLSTATSRYLGLNRTASTLWDELAAGTTVEALTAVLRREYHLSHEVARGDVEAFLAECRARGLLAET